MTRNDHIWQKFKIKHKQGIFDNKKWITANKEQYSNDYDDSDLCFSQRMYTLQQQTSTLG